MSKPGLLGIRTFIIPVGVVQATISFLRKVGSEGFEGFVLWSGDIIDGKRFHFSTTIVPEQRAMMTKNGLLVTVDGKALFEVNKSVHERNQVLAAQVHSHPTDAYHSETDDTFPLVTLVGALSIVIPDFAYNAPADVERWAWYRLSHKAKWLPVNRATRIEFQ